MRTAILSMCASAGALLANGSALASSSDGQQNTIGSWSNSEGNSTVGNSETVVSSENSIWVRNYESAFAGQPQNATISNVVIINDNVTFFGQSYSAFQLNAGASATMKGSLGAASLGESVATGFYLGGQQVATGTRDANCPSFGQCQQINFSVSKTLFSAKGSVTVAYIPLNVSVGLAASVSANPHALSVAVSSAPQFVGQPVVSLTGNAALTANFSASAGISGVLGAGITASFKMISASLNESAGQQLAITPTNAQDSWSNSAVFTMTSMSGSVSAWAQITPFYKPSTTLVSWNGFTLANDTLINTGSNRVSYP